MAVAIDRRLAGAFPGQAQYYRWLRGDVRSRPYPDACRILEAMFPGWSIGELFRPYTGSLPLQRAAQDDGPPVHPSSDLDMLDLRAVYASRSEFVAKIPIYQFMEEASLVRASGLSLNLLTQHYADMQLRRLVETGTRFQLLFLDPESEAMKLREHEEGYATGFLAGLTDLNIKIVQQRVRGALPGRLRERVEIRVSDGIIRFNIMLFDERTAIVQPYLPEARGVDSPTFLVQTDEPDAGLFATFEQVFTSLWERAKQA